MKAARAIYFLAAIVVLVIVDRTVFSSPAAQQAVLTAKNDPAVTEQLGAIDTARVAKRLEYAIGPDWIQRESFVIRMSGSKQRGLVTVERPLPAKGQNGSAFHVTHVELQ